MTEEAEQKQLEKSLIVFQKTIFDAIDVLKKANPNIPFQHIIPLVVQTSFVYPYSFFETAGKTDQFLSIMTEELEYFMASVKG